MKWKVFDCASAVYDTFPSVVIGRISLPYPPAVDYSRAAAELTARRVHSLSNLVHYLDSLCSDRNFASRSLFLYFGLDTFNEVEFGLRNHKILSSSPHGQFTSQDIQDLYKTLRSVITITSGFELQVGKSLSTSMKRHSDALSKVSDLTGIHQDRLRKILEGADQTPQEIVTLRRYTRIVDANIKGFDDCRRYCKAFV